MRNDNNKEVVLNDEQLGRLDEIYNAAHDFVKILLQNPDMDFDQHYAGEITDFAVSCLVADGLKVYYPGIVEDEDGTQHIEEIVSNIHTLQDS